MSELPKGWSNTSLKNALSQESFISDGDWVESKDQDPNGSIRLLQLADIGDGLFKNKSSRFMTDDSAKRLNCTFLEVGDLLIARMPDPLGRACIFNGVNQKAVTVVDVCLIRNKGESAFSNELLKFWINSPWFRNLINSNASGSTRKRITRKKLETFSLPVPPLAEQKRIVEKLDQVLAQVDTIKSRLDGIPTILKRFRQSVLAAAVSGKLTEEWRKKLQPEPFLDFSSRALLERKNKGFRENKHTKKSQVDNTPFIIPDSWIWTRLGHICLKITDGAHNTPKVILEGYPYLMAKDLTGGKLDFSEKRYISEKEHKELYLKCLPEFGDLLVVNIGAGTGNNVLVTVDFEFSFKNIAIIKKPDFVKSEYLKYFFDAQKQRIFDEQVRGGAQPFLSLTVLNDIPFALPSIVEQTEIVRLVDQYFAFADTIEKQVQKAQQRVDKLTQSILAKAFRGELVPQNPDDEPADQLLKRIAAARAESEALAKAAKKVSKKK